MHHKRTLHFDKFFAMSCTFRAMMSSNKLTVLNTITFPGDMCSTTAMHMHTLDYC